MSRGAKPAKFLSSERAERPHFGVLVSITHLNRIRVVHGVARQPAQMKKNLDQSSTPERDWQDGAGGLLLVAAVHETGLLAHLETALASYLTKTSHLHLSLSLPSQRSLLLTLLFLNAVGLRRARDLRGYTDEALGLLTGRRRAYNYWHTERFLSHLATAGGGGLTNALEKWTATLWPDPRDTQRDCSKQAV